MRKLDVVSWLIVGVCVLLLGIWLFMFKPKAESSEDLATSQKETTEYFIGTSTAPCYHIGLGRYVFPHDGMLFYLCRVYPSLIR